MSHRHRIRHLLLAMLVLVAASSALAQPDLALSSATSPTDCLYICPAGDGQSLAGITVTLLDANGDPVAGYPADQIWADASIPGDLTYCTTAFLADAPTDANGQTTITGTAAGGGYTQEMQVYVNGQPLIGAPLDITVVSPDINGDGAADICDLDLLAIDVAGAYQYRSDFNCDLTINLTDIAIFATHYCHTCPDHSYGTIPTSGSIGVFFDPAATQTGASIPNGVLFDFYVIAIDAPGGIMAYEFGIDLDPRYIVLTAIFQPVGTAINLTSTTGDAIVATGGFCLPATGPTVLAQFQALMVSSDLDIPICLRGATGSCVPDGQPGYLPCDAACDWHYFGPAYEGCAMINGDGPVAVESQTWSAIKSLYRD